MIRTLARRPLLGLGLPGAVLLGALGLGLAGPAAAAAPAATRADATSRATASGASPATTAQNTAGNPAGTRSPVARAARVDGTAPERMVTTVALATGDRPVVVVGVPGLLWSDVSATATPNLWRLAGDGADGNLVVHAVQGLTCPADGWLTLNAGARAMAPRPASDRCTALPPVDAGSPYGALTEPSSRAVSPVFVTDMGSLERYNRQFHYNPNWGLLDRAAGPGECVTAIGPGAALALANTSGIVRRYRPAASDARRSDYTQCPLTVVDLGAVPTGSRRAAAVHTADQELGRIRADLPPGATLVVAALADGAVAHLHPIVIDGPGFHHGLLDSAATRQPGLVTLTDLTPTLLHWRGVAAPSDAVGSVLTVASRGSLASTVRDLIGQDTAAQVYRGTFGWFFAAYGVADFLAFATIAGLVWGGTAEQRRRRGKLWRAAGTVACAVPAASFLASLVPWWLLAHPAVWLYALAVAWTAVIGAAALAGPWRRDPLGPLGVVTGVTAAVIAVDIATGSHLQIGTPFGLSTVVAGRFYGIGNNVVVMYATAGLFCAGWLGLTVLRRRGAGGSRRTWAALAATAAVAVIVVGVAGWPGFGAKVGGTFAMVPGFAIILLGVAGLRMTPRRAVVALGCGVVVVAAFAAINYVAPSTGQSDIGGFFGQVLHGGAGGTLSRKIGSNVGSLTTSAYALIVPPVVVVAGLMLVWPAWFRLKTLPRAWAAEPLLRVILAALWVVAVLCWFAEDSGVTVVASGLPFVLPLGIAAAAARGGPTAAEAAAGPAGPGPAAGAAPAHPDGQVILGPPAGNGRQSPAT